MKSEPLEKKPPAEFEVTFIKPHEHAGHQYQTGDTAIVNAGYKQHFEKIGVISNGN
jgi:hypothetical protein